MKRILKRAIGAALLTIVVPVAAAAATPGYYPAIETGLAIPGGPVVQARPAMLAIPAGYGRSYEIPARGRAVIVDASSARLYMIEDGQVRDSMRVIVGKPDAATPIIASTLYYATLNPYWNVPADLARTIIAPNVLKYGTGFLSYRDYEVVTSFNTDAKVISPDKVDWEAVAAGTTRIHVRQRPRPDNSMGRIKFGFANSDGIYLHDTPKKELFSAASRQLSHGCVRLEDAARLARWLLGRDPDLASAGAEQHVPLPRGIPIIITYLDQAPAPAQVAALR